MDLSYNTINLFPSSIHKLKITDFYECKDELVKDVYQERERDSIGRIVSNVGGWQSNMTYLEDCKSETLQKIIANIIFEFNKNL